MRLFRVAPFPAVCLHAVSFVGVKSALLVSRLGKMVVGTGFEPVKAKPAGLQPAPFDRFGILPSGRGGVWSQPHALVKLVLNGHHRFVHV